MSAPPLVTIGLPVFNGGPHFPDAVASLLAQDYPALELVLCDNASTDGTEMFGRALAEREPRVRYLRQPRNLGPLPNFRRALDEARGEYFLWAAHDDRWPENYVSTLAALLDARPNAVLATARAKYFTSEGPPTSQADDRAATAGDRLGNLQLFFRDAATCWIYGLFRRDWLAAHADELIREPVWAWDVRFLYQLLLRFPVVGSDAVAIEKRVYKGRHHTRRTDLERVRFWGGLLADFRRRCRGSTLTPRERRDAMRAARGYVYRAFLGQPNPAKTALRLAKTVGWAPLALPSAWQILRCGLAHRRGA